MTLIMHGSAANAFIAPVIFVSGAPQSSARSTDATKFYAVNTPGGLMPFGNQNENKKPTNENPNTKSISPQLFLRWLLDRHVSCI